MRILIADDEWLVRQEIKESLEELGHQIVAEAGDGEAAVRLARSLKPDVAILDIKMPLRDGLDAAQELVREQVCPIVLLTAYALPEYIQKARDAGAFGFVTKPFDPKGLDAALQLAVARFEDFCRLRQEVGQLEEELATRKLVERAKGLLMKHYRLSEQEAYRVLQRRSMETRKPLREIAEAVLMTWGLVDELSDRPRKKGSSP
ncbi:MAG: response regulator [Armatimonadetes bacterium]|nr:response regulator [Armatimonadota bacterium]MDW8122228.1 response regulator [Armatimonadota bacterium]